MLKLIEENDTCRRILFAYIAFSFAVMFYFYTVVFRDDAYKEVSISRQSQILMQGKSYYVEEIQYWIFYICEYSIFVILFSILFLKVLDFLRSKVSSRR